MEVIFSKDVERGLERYKNSLKKYPITEKRAHEKWAKMVNSLKSLGTAAYIPAVCTRTDLLQVLDDKENPVYKDLRQYNYEDESGFPWAFSCLYNEEEGTITIMKMKPGRFVAKENKQPHKVTPITVAHIRQMVIEELRRAFGY